jgi:hypothetical protein
MLHLKQETIQEEEEIVLLREWLPQIGEEHRAYIKGATEALLYAQEDSEKPVPVLQEAALP